tara:strand:+ start:146 stop:622 length:477 start_codon:yes stop_codon:yes gene_type:complete
MGLDSQLNIRLAKLSDLEKINNFWWRLINEQKKHDDRILDSDTNMHRSMTFLRDRISQGGLYVSEIMPYGIVGLGSAAQDLHFLQTKINIWNISDIWVKKDFRRRGFASKMVSYLENICFEKGAEEIRLTVYSDNESAFELYKSLEYSSKIITFSKLL